MKTTISIPDELFESAERFAQRQGMSRSELYATALRHYLQEHRSEGITEQLDEIYSKEAGVLDPAIVRLQAWSFPKEAWKCGADGPHAHPVRRHPHDRHAGR